MLRAAFPVLFGIALSACAVGPDYKTLEVAVPDQWESSSVEVKTTTVAAPDLSRWWERLNDPLLNALIEEAVQGNLDVATAKAKIRQARAGYRKAGGALEPVVDGTSSATKSRSYTDGASSTSQFEVGFDASWELDLFGANRRALEAARYGLDAAQHELRATLLTMIGDISSYFVEARGYRARIALARETAKSQRETAALIRSKFEAGASSAVDMANAVGQASSTEATIPALEVSYAEAVHRLSVLTGRTPTFLSARMSGGDIIPEPPFPIPAGVPANLLLARPDIRVAERQLAQYTAQIGEAEAARYPQIRLTGSLSTASSRFGDLANTSSISWWIGPTISVPIFNGGQLKEAVKEAEALRDQYYIAFRAAILIALEDVENALISLQQERIRYAALTESMEAYRDATNLSQSLFRAGSFSFLDALDAERSFYSAEDSVIQSRIATTKYYIALCKALGGGWDGAIDTEKPEVIDTNTGPRLVSDSD